MEVFRPMPIESRGDVAPFVLGLARIRGRTMPVVDLRLLLGDLPDGNRGRYVSLRSADRLVALCVDEVLCLREVPASETEDLPPMLVPGNPAVEALATLDQSLLFLLRTARLFPSERWGTA